MNNDDGHRPYPPPTTAPMMRMTWHDLLFAHGRVPADKLQALLPPGIVPFRMSDVAWGLSPV